MGERSVGGWPRRLVVGARLRPSSDESGLTLLELVVAISVFAILASSIAAVASSGFRLAGNNRDRSIAANLASQDIDAAQQASFSTLVAETSAPVTTTVHVPSPNGPAYTVTRDVAWVSQTADTSLCQYAGPVDKKIYLLGVTTSVSWPSRPSGIAPASATTTVSPPVNFSPVSSNQGTVPVTVHNSVGANADDGIPVTLNDGVDPPQTVNTQNGCAFFVVNAGTYTVSMSLANYVDRSGNATPSRTFSISAGGIVPEVFDYDLGGSLALTPAASNGGTMPTGVPVTLAYQFFQPTQLKTFPAWNGTSWAVNGLFPDTYEFYAGDCSDADPLSWPGGTRDAGATVPRGGATAPASVTVGGVDVTATQGGLPFVGATVTAVETGTCPAGSPSLTGYTLGTTDATGKLHAALPWGHWNVSVTPSSGPSTYSVVLDPTASPSTVSVVAAL